ncbi:hypothetical protein K8638_38915 [Myxococcus sp. RHST-1-4]|nr:hypothetical protein [Myxococcus sp. RHSTA-1-4]
MGGGWWSKSEGDVTVTARVGQGDVRFEGEAGGDEEDLGGLEVELFYEDDLEFQIASF